MTQHRISFFVHDLAANPIVRAAPLALALQSEYQVEVLGFLLTGEEVYKPYRDMFEYKTLRCSLGVSTVLSSICRLASMATGDIVYACKPLLTSLGPALVASRLGFQKPLLLDVEDDEWLPMGRTWKEFLWRDVIKGWRHATAWKYTRMLHPLTHCASSVSVVSLKLQQRYGGVLVRHGPDERVFDPRRPELSEPYKCRRYFGLPNDRKLALFAGVPQPHKGWSVLLEALLTPQCSMWDLVLAGPPDHPDFELAFNTLRSRCHRLGPRSHSEMPSLLAAVDAVPVPQHGSLFSQSQVPAKALEAMAMAKPVLGSRVGDLPVILGYGERGWLFDADDVNGLSVALAEVAGNPEEASRRGLAGRHWFLQEASASAIRQRLAPVMISIQEKIGGISVA